MNARIRSLGVSAAVLIGNSALAGVAVTFQGKDQSVIYLDGNKMRIETRRSPDSHEAIIIYDGDNQRMIAIQPEKKTYSEMTPDSFKATTGKAQEQVKESMAQITPGQRKQMDAATAQMDLTKQTGFAEMMSKAQEQVKESMAKMPAEQRKQMDTAMAQMDPEKRKQLEEVMSKAQEQVKESMAQMTAEQRKQMDAVMAQTDEKRKQLEEVMSKAQEQVKESMAQMPPEQRKQMDAVMAQMDPEKRKRLEALMSGRIGGSSKVGTVQPQKDEVQWDRTGSQQIVAGYRCEGFKELTNGKLEAQGCYIPWNLGAVTKADLAPMLKMQEFMSQAGWGAAAPASQRIFEKFNSAPGFPGVWERVSSNGQLGDKQTMTSVKRGGVSADKFQPPAGFSKVDWTRLGHGTN